MSLPKKIKVGAMRFEVRLASELADDGKYGATNVWGQSILLQPGQAADFERDTLLHEVLHAIVAESGLRAWFTDQDKEEELIRVLAPALLEVLRENKSLVGYLCG